MPVTKIFENGGITAYKIDDDKEGRKFLYDVSSPNCWCCNRAKPEVLGYGYGCPHFFLKDCPGCLIIETGKNPLKDKAIALWCPSDWQYYGTYDHTYLGSEFHKKMTDLGVYRAMRANGCFDATSERAKRALSLFHNNPNMEMGSHGIGYEKIETTKGDIFSAAILGSQLLEDAKKHPILAWMWYWNIEKIEDLLTIIAQHPISAYHQAKKAQNRFILGEPAIATDPKGVEFYLHMLSSRQLAKPAVKEEINKMAVEFQKILAKSIKTRTKATEKNIDNLRKKFINKHIKRILKSDITKTVKKVEKAPSKRSIKASKRAAGVLS